MPKPKRRRLCSPRSLSVLLILSCAALDACGWPTSKHLITLRRVASLIHGPLAISGTKMMNTHREDSIVTSAVDYVTAKRDRSLVMRGELSLRLQQRFCRHRKRHGGTSGARGVHVGEDRKESQAGPTPRSTASPLCRILSCRKAPFFTSALPSRSNRDYCETTGDSSGMTEWSEVELGIPSPL